MSNARRPSALIVVAGPFDFDGRYPLELGLAAGFINPRYGVDDIIAKYVCAGGTEAMYFVYLCVVRHLEGRRTR